MPLAKLHRRERARGAQGTQRFGRDQRVRSAGGALWAGGRAVGGARARPGGGASLGRGGARASPEGPRIPSAGCEIRSGCARVNHLREAASQLPMKW